MSIDTTERNEPLLIITIPEINLPLESVDVSINPNSEGYNGYSTNCFDNWVNSLPTTKPGQTVMLLPMPDSHSATGGKQIVYVEVIGSGKGSIQQPSLILYAEDSSVIDVPFSASDYKHPSYVRQKFRYNRKTGGMETVTSKMYNNGKTANTKRGNMRKRGRKK